MTTVSKMRDVRIPYGAGETGVAIPTRNLLGVYSPHDVAPCADPAAEIRRALDSPIAAPPLALAARGARRVAILADDLTRQTPVQTIIPLLLDELNVAGIVDDQVQVIIALGTHRPMTPEEIEQRFGWAVLGRVPVINNPWQDLSQLVDLGATSNGTPIKVGRPAVDADFLIGLGSIVPHHIPGYSAGAKIIQPGVCGAETTGATHLLSTRTSRSYLGRLETPVRAELEAIAQRVGLTVVLNTVLDRHGRLVRAFYGDFRQAFRQGAAMSRRVYGVPLPRQADIVIAGSHPCDIEFWQAHKSLYAADVAVREGGTVIIVTPCPEGVAVTHGDMLEFTALDAETIIRHTVSGTIKDSVSGGMAVAWAKMRERAGICLVSGGITTEETRALGFAPFASLDDALQAALRRHGPEASVAVLTHAPDMLPIIEANAHDGQHAHH